MVFKSKAPNTAGKASAGTATKPVRAATARAVAAETEAEDLAGLGGDTYEGEDVLGLDPLTKGKKKPKEVENEYELLEPGTIIDGVKYPLVNTAADTKAGIKEVKVKPGEEMICRLTHSAAQEHQMRGIRLRRRKEE